MGRDQGRGEEAKGERPKLLLESVPRALPALVEAQQISSRAAGAGFDWETWSRYSRKLHEELA